MSMNERTLYIIDGHSQVFKAYHAIQHLSTSTGIPTNAVYGFVQILHRLLKTRKPQHLVVAFDSPKKNFRHEMYSEYKANRLAPPEDLALQIEYIHKILRGMAIPILACEGYEADDIIATIARHAVAEGFSVVVVTPDKDLFQLVNDQVRVLRLETDKDTEFDREAVHAKMGVYPEMILDMLAMVGDSSDNVPGIAKVGPKTAITLLERFGSLEVVLENASTLTGKQREYVEAGRESALLSKRLVTLDYKTPVTYDLQEFAISPPDIARLAPIYKELEFRKLLDDLDIPVAERKTDYRIISSLEELQAFVEEARANGVLSFDVETDSLDTIDANLVGISLSTRKNAGVYIPVGHTCALDFATPQLEVAEVVRMLRPLFDDPKVRKVAHNSKFDRKVMRKHGLCPHPVESDTLIASYLLNPDKRNHGLKALADDLLGIKMTPITDLIGTGSRQLSFADTDIESAGQYSCADADMTLQLSALLEPKLDESHLRKVYEEIELPLIGVLMDMEDQGVCVDREHFRRLAAEMEHHLADLRAQIFLLAGREFNVGSPKQVAEILFDDLKLNSNKKTKTGQSTDVSVLEELALIHDLPRLLLDYRQIEKLKGTYADVLPTLVKRRTSRIHTTYNQAVAATGRLSSNDPNLQNIPVRTEAGRKIRQGFRPSSPENVLLSADYSQVELRVLAHITRDPALVEAYRTGTDIHRLTASKVYGVEPENVSPEMRDYAKVINFGIIYGMSANGLSTRLKIPFAAARQFIEEYFKAYTGVQQWIAGVLETARTQGYVATLTGRRRYLPDINSRNFNARSAAERVAVNAPIQGSSADMIKIAMINIHNWLKGSGLHTTMIMQVHDELIFDVPKSELDDVLPKVRDYMQDALPLDVPVQVDTKIGSNWAEC